MSVKTKVAKFTEALPLMQQHGPTSLLQQDSAIPHTANVTRQFLAKNNVNVLDWPAYSPDLSPIKHIWDYMDDGFVKMVTIVHTINDPVSLSVQILATAFSFCTEAVAALSYRLTKGNARSHPGDDDRFAICRGEV